MYLGRTERVPPEYAFMELDELRREPPGRRGRARAARGRLRERAPARPTPGCSSARRSSLDVDHHHDNTRFGDVNLIVPTRRRPARSCATCSRELGVELTPEIAEALYIALVTDTGRFQYSNTTPKALRLAAELVEAGADIHHVFQRVYENVEFAKLKLLARALERAQVLRGRAGRRLATSCAATSPRSAPRSRTARGSSTTCAPSRARSWRR